MQAAIFFLSLVSLCAASSVFVQVKQGRLKGTRTEYFSDEYVDEYHGIPYAKPPTGNLRFRPPVPAGGWTGTKDATQLGPVCPQPAQANTNEDCLYLNVYQWKSKAGTTPQLPVMVFIHGGAFVTGSSNLYRSNIMALHSVVVVTINYRLGPLGFMSTGDDASPGNYGMLDQILALKWVRDNIAAFGGNPGMITVFGESAGSASTSLHLLSPLSRGLFHGAIMESGVSLSPWAIRTNQDHPTPLDQTRLLAGKVGCTETNTTLLVNCMQNVQVQKIVSVQDSIQAADFRLKYSPVVGDAYGFLPDLPITLIESSKMADVPTIRGVNKDENAKYLASVHGITHGMSLGTARAAVRDYVRRHFQSNSAVEAALERVYLGNINSSDHDLIRSKMIQLISDKDFYIPILTETEKQATKGTSDVFLYEFDYRSPKDPTPVWEGVIHTAELYFVFGAPFQGGSRWSQTDKVVSSRVTGAWTNFAKHKDPTYNHITWAPFNATTKDYLAIGTTSVMRTNPRGPAEILWRVTIPNILRSTAIVG